MKLDWTYIDGTSPSTLSTRSRFLSPKGIMISFDQSEISLALIWGKMSLEAFNFSSVAYGKRVSLSLLESNWPCGATEHRCRKYNDQ